MTTDKRKAQLRDAQKRHRANKIKRGWRWLQIPPELLEEVKSKIKEYVRKNK